MRRCGMWPAVAGVVMLAVGSAPAREVPFIEAQTIPASGSSVPHVEFAGDFDRDGDLDLLLWGNRLAWRENPGDLAAEWPEHIVDPDRVARSAKGADIDRDGDLDIVSGPGTGSTIDWWENLDGVGGTWARHGIDTGLIGSDSVHCADMDGDGDLDAAGVISGSSSGVGRFTIWWENDDGRGGSWTRHVVGDIEQSHRIALADVDGDGDIDLVANGFADARTVWWENADGLGETWTERIVDPSSRHGFAVGVGDIDRDGDLDIAGAVGSGDLTWWENIDRSGTQWAAHRVSSRITDSCIAKAIIPSSSTAGLSLG